MASTLFRPIPTTQSRTPHSPPPLPNSKTLFPSLPIPHLHQTHHHPLFFSPQKPRGVLLLCLSQTQQHQQPSSSSSSSPPSTREEAILQAKTCLSTTLQKPLNNTLLLPSKKLKRQKHPRFRVEIPVVDDDSPGSLAQLAFEVFSDLPVKRKGAKPSVLILWPDPALLESARRAFTSSAELNDSVVIVNSELASVSPGILSSADLAVFLAPDASLLDHMRRVSDEIYPKPVVLFNPRWGFEEEKGFGGGLGGFAGSFEVVYAFMGLEVRGILTRRKGVVFRCVKDGVFSGEGWVVMVDDEEGKKKKEGEMKVVTRFKKRPSIGEVESVLYNLMAANSPVTKSVKFVRDLISNATGRKGK